MAEQLKKYQRHNICLQNMQSRAGARASQPLRTNCEHSDSTDARITFLLSCALHDGRRFNARNKGSEQCCKAGPEGAKRSAFPQGLRDHWCTKASWKHPGPGSPVADLVLPPCSCNVIEEQQQQVPPKKECHTSQHIDVDTNQICASSP